MQQIIQQQQIQNISSSLKMDIIIFQQYIFLYNTYIHICI